MNEENIKTETDYNTKYECNLCADTENGYAPCILYGLFTPEICPISGDEAEWEISKILSDKQLQAENDQMRDKLNTILAQLDKADRYGVGMIKLQKEGIRQALKE